MESNAIAEILLPLAIVLIMIAMGATLTMDDFRRLLTQRKAVATGLFCQLIVLPIIAFGTAWAFSLTTIFAVSMILLAASPGGSTSNLIAHISDADRALSLTLTAVSNMVVFATLPFYLGIAQDRFGALDGDLAVPASDLIVQVAALTVIPVAIGIAISAAAPNFAKRTDRPGKILSTSVLAVAIAILVVQNWDQIVEEVPRFGPAFLVMNALGLAAGWGIATLAGLSKREVATIGIETGLQNTTISLTIAITVFDSEELAIIPGLYGLWMFVTGFAFAYWMKARFEARDDAEDPLLSVS